MAGGARCPSIQGFRVLLPVCSAQLGSWQSLPPCSPTPSQDHVEREEREEYVPEPGPGSLTPTGLDGAVGRTSEPLGVPLGQSSDLPGSMSFL